MSGASTGSGNPVFDRLKKSKYGYVATGWARFIANLSRPENAEIAEIIKNDRDFFAHNEAVHAAKDIGRLRRAIKLAIGRAGAVAYMEKGKIERGGIKPEWDWRDFTSKVIDAGLSIPKEGRHMWVLNCNSLKKGERIKLPGTKEEYEVLDVASGEAKITGPLGRISAKSEVLVWRPGSQFAEKVSVPTSSTQTAKIAQEKADSRTLKRMTIKGETMATRKPGTEATSGSGWRQNDGEVTFGFGMLVKRGKLTGKVIRAHGSKLRVRLDGEGGTVEWSADDESIYWKSVLDGDDGEGNQKRSGGGGKATGKATPPVAKRGKVEEPEEEEEEEEEEIEDPEEETEPEEEEEGEEYEEEEEIDPDDLPDDDDDLLEGEEEEEEDEVEEEEGEEAGNEEQEEDQEEGEEQFAYTYSGNDIAELAGVDYQRVNKLKTQGHLDGTFVQAANGRIRYSKDAVELVKNAPRNRPGRPPGGGKKATAPTAAPRPEARPVEKAPRKPAPQQQTIPTTPMMVPAAPKVEITRSTAPAAPADVFAYTIGHLEAEIERRTNEIERLREAKQVIQNLAR